MNTDLRKKEKMILKKIFLVDNTVFGKNMENVKKNMEVQQNIKVITKRRRNYLVSEPNYHTTKFSNMLK